MTCVVHKNEFGVDHCGTLHRNIACSISIPGTKCSERRFLSLLLSMLVRELLGCKWKDIAILSTVVHSINGGSRKMGGEGGTSIASKVGLVHLFAVCSLGVMVFRLS